jgi:hypothetical protein
VRGGVRVRRLCRRRRRRLLLPRRRIKPLQLDGLAVQQGAVGAAQGAACGRMGGELDRGAPGGSAALVREDLLWGFVWLGFG